MTSPDRYVPRIDDGGTAEGRRIEEILARGLVGLDGPVVGAVIDLISAAVSGAYAGDDPRLGAIRDGQLELRDRLDVYSSLEEQGTAFMSTSDPVMNVGLIPFTERLSGSKGVRFEAGGIVMLDRGRWDIDAMITADWIAITGNILDFTRVTWEIRVVAPNGQPYHVKTGVFHGQGPMTGQLFTRVVVPEPGYRAEVHVSSIAPFRGLLRGPQWSHLTVAHINKTTGSGATGAEPSDAPKGEG